MNKLKKSDSSSIDSQLELNFNEQIQINIAQSSNNHTEKSTIVSQNVISIHDYNNKALISKIIKSTKSY